MGNTLTGLAGFVLGSQDKAQTPLVYFALLGLALIVAAGCVFNNYLDRDLDKKMARTKARPLSQGIISPQRALLFAMILGSLGSFVLAYCTNLLTLYIALVGFVIYVLFYGLFKYHSMYATEIGSIAGAVPPLIGYCAASARLDGGALLLFFIVALWQMPHFFAIALFRMQEYAAASIPVVPIVKGIYQTKVRILFYTLVFTAVAPLLSLCGYTGSIYLFSALFLAIVWSALAIRGFVTATSPILWARMLFSFSLVVITALSLLIIFDKAS